MSTSTAIEVYVRIDASEYTTYTQESLGLNQGIFRWRLGNIPGWISGYTAGILTEVGDINRSVDISETGGLSTDGSFSCTIKNTDGFQAVLKSYGIKFIGLPVDVKISEYKDLQIITKTVFTGFVLAWSVSDIDINISANVDSIIPTKDLQNTVVDLDTWPNAPEDSIGLPYPVVFGDVEYSPLINATELRNIKCGPFPLDITSDDYYTNGTYRLHIYDDYFDGFNCEVGDLISFCSGPNAPTKKYSIVGKGYNYIVIKGLLVDYSSHTWAPPWEATPFVVAWWYNIENNQGELIASKNELIEDSFSTNDTLSAYSSDQYINLYGIAKGQTNGIIEISTDGYAISSGALSTSSTISLVKSLDNGFNISIIGSDPITLDPPYDPIWDYDWTGNYDGFYNRSYEGGVSFERLNAYKDTTVQMNRIFSVDIPDTDSDILLSVDFWAPEVQHHFMKSMTINAWTKSATNLEYSSVAIPEDTVQIIGKQLAPFSYYTRDTVSLKTSDDSYLLADDDNYNSCFLFPKELYKGIKSGAIEFISIGLKIRTTLSGYPDPTIIIKGACWIYDTTTQDAPNYYIATEGESLNNDLTTHCNTISTALEHMAVDYAGLPNINTVGATFANHVGRTLTEQITVSDAISSICKQAFVAGYINGNGTPSFKSWLESSGDTPAYAFTSRNIIRDSISGWSTTSLSNCYNSFDIKYDLDYETGAYRYKMGIKSPQTDFPLATEAWDGLVYGIGTGSDTTAYAEAQEAHSFVEDGYDETGIIKAMPSEMGELSWYVDPSWVGTPVAKTDLSAWKYLKNCAWWLSAPRKEVTFRIPLTFLGIELLDYCSFTDTIFTSGEVYYGWVTSLRISTEDIEIKMSMERPVTTIRYNETGSADTTIDETGSRSDTITEGA